MAGTQTIVQKLQIPAGAKGIILNKPAGVSLGLRHSAKGRDYFIAFVTSPEQVGQLITRVSQLDPSCVLWFCYPKKTSGVPATINRDSGWERLYETGFRGVRSIAVDEVWTGLRFRLRKAC